MLGEPLGQKIEASLGPIRASLGDSPWASFGASLWHSLRNNLWAILANLGDSLGDSTRSPHDR